MAAVPAATLAAYLEWADRRLLAAIRPLSEELYSREIPSSFGSLARTVEHVFAAEWTWRERVCGRTPASIGPEGGATSRDRLDALWPPVWADWRRVVAERDPAEPISYHTTRGEPQVTALGAIWLHVSHHSATYRGQAVALLRVLGQLPPATDLILFLRESR